MEITRTQDGASSVIVAVERLDTLRTLQADMAHLHLALDRAGVPEQRSLVVHLSTSQEITQLGGSPAQTAGGHSGSERGSQQNQQGQAASAWAGKPGSTLASDSVVPAAPIRQVRAGIDVTA